jgi:sugar O-acyltransferase (sialic acid O-acetyltransferase NeuD family)
MGKKIIIFGTDIYAQIVYTFFSEASDYEVIAFTVHRDHRKQDKLFELPVVDFETVAESYPPDTYKMYIAVAQSKLNKVRARIFNHAKDLGYTLVSYVYPGVKIFSNVTIGENCFIFDGCSINPFVEIGDNVIIWQGCVVGHHSKIRDHVFMAGPSAIASNVEVGDYTFIGVNATVREGIQIGEECFIGAGALIMRNTKPRQVFAQERTRPAKQDVYQLFSFPE